MTKEQLNEWEQQVSKMTKYQSNEQLQDHSYRSIESTKILLEAGVDISAKNKALKSAAYGGYFESVEYLIENGADVNYDEGEPLKNASQQGYSKTVKVLLKKGASTNLKRALWMAVRSGRINTTKVLIAAGAGVNAPDFPLIDAVENGRVAMAELLLDAGANIEVKYGEDKLTVLMLAEQKKDIDMIKLLLEKGADINAKNKYCETVLVNAIKRDDIFFKTEDIIKLLLDNGADVNAKCEEGTPISIIAARKLELEILWQLLDKGADINAKDSDGWTLLNYAARNNLIEIAITLLEKGADINSKDNRGFTALKWAEYFSLDGMVKLLKDYKAIK